MKAICPLRGGILADGIGYGKTASTIGLIDATLRGMDAPIASWYQDCFIPTNATLILVPGSLLEQWLGEYPNLLEMVVRRKRR